MRILTPTKGVGLLKKQIRRGEDLLQRTPFDSEDYFGWEHTAEEVLNSCFGIESGMSARFAAISNIGFWVIGEDHTPENKNALKQQILFLKNAVEILETEIEPPSEMKPIKSAEMFNTDPLKRRYQVFVSSTYQDLEDERRHIMQALLETKCIPTGMELFPAANEKQWDLIRKVIDDCDYYIVVVAGKYGSLGPDGKSYTEMEFDYAISSHKSVMGFFHENLDDLPGSKLEKNDSRREQLKVFTEKVKRRMCKSWASSEGLASAIKSAILNAIEHDPKPGWIRANDLASAAAISNLKESVQKQSKKFEGEKPLEIRVGVSYWEADEPDPPTYARGKQKSFSQKFEMTDNELFLVLGPRLETKRQRKAVKMFLESLFLAKIEKVDSDTPGKYNIGFHCDLSVADIQRILDIFVARKLVKIVQPPKGLSTRVPYWEITSKGQQRLAELRVGI